MLRIVVLILLCSLVTTNGYGAEGAVTQPALTGDLKIHDPTAIEVDGMFVAFATGFEGGIDRGALRIKTSPDGIAWTDRGALGKGLPAWVPPALGVKPPNLWAPTISRRGDIFYLYYAASIFGVNTSAIGLATNVHFDPQHPADGWIDQGLVLKTGIKDSFNAIDPFRVDTPDGRAWLSFGSYWDGIKLRELDPVSGKLKPDAATLYGLASRHGAAIEASSIIEHAGHYYLFVSYDRCCSGITSTYHIMVGRADAVTGPYLDQNGKPMLQGYATLVERSDGRFIGPGGQEAFKTPAGDMLVYHYYDGADGGTSKLELAPLRWSADGWPTLDPLPE